ncbi:hypothetical protein [Anaerococcus degeneri]|uniref:Uncharacterized protein n=1 Tax=Anaerococcus degeneri TaxID=361500 RepID=A0ABS7YVA1_9FIRM|nr:hypothetical protein [Anaerococcus degeneri]MBP2015913.1 putative nucleic-acid-binding Zn-ribbon protein [Anaerococcus degeneri]MCA2095663.1 hypothetical protein [Anaerococcus degeneri]
MKNSNKCPKYGSSDIIKIPGHAGAYGTGNNIMVGMTTISAVPVDRYLCASCGYSEGWIDTDNIQKIEKKFKD